MHRSVWAFIGATIGGGMMFVGVVRPERSEAKRVATCLSGVLTEWKKGTTSIKDVRCVPNPNGRVDIFFIQ